MFCWMWGHPEARAMWKEAQGLELTLKKIAS